MAKSAYQTVAATILVFAAQLAEHPANAQEAPAPAAPAATTRTEPAAVPQPTAPPSAVPAPTPQELHQRRVAVEVQSSAESTILERRVSATESHGAFIILPTRNKEENWEQVCVTPCRVELDRFSSYRVAAQGRVSASSTFTIPQDKESMALRIDAGNRRAQNAAKALGLLGAAAAVVGGSLLVAAHNVVDHDREVGTRTAGIVTGAAGLVALGVAIPWAILTCTHVYEGDRELTRR